jgi:glycosyltransferase involved in cell wall biosynthesis
MRTVLFAQQNYEKLPPYRVLTTIEQDGDDVRVYKRACSPAATTYVHGLLEKQRLLQGFIGDRATVVLGRLDQDGRVSYPFVRFPTVQLLISEQVLQGDYTGAYAFLKQWMDWIGALATVEAAADDNDALVEIYGESLPHEATTCLPLSLLDLTLDNVLWDRQNDRYYLIDHEFVFPGPAPVTLVRFRSLFYLCLRLHMAFAAGAQSHPLRLISHPHFLVPVEWDIDLWITPDQWPLLFAGERQLQEHYGIRVNLEYVGEQLLQARPQPNVGARLAQLQWDLHMLQQQAAQQEQTLAALTDQAAQREQMVAALTDQAAQREQTLAALTDQAAQREQMVAALTDHAAQREQMLAALQAANTEQEQTIAALQAANTEQEQTIAVLRAQNAEREQVLTTLEVRLHEVESYWGRVQMSAGWALLQQLRRLRLHLAPSGSRRERVLKRALQRLRSRKLKDSRVLIEEHKHDHAEHETLMLAIDSHIPDSITVGKGNVLFLAGWCYHPQTALTRLELMVNDAVYPVNIRSMPRRDVREAFYPHRDPKGHSFRSGFWSFVPFQECHDEQQVELCLRAKLRNGATAMRTCATITVRPRIESDPLTRPARFERRPSVAICMTTYNPSIELFSRQIDSIRRQTYSDWICIISDDHSRTDIFEQIRDIVGADERFQIYRNPSNLGFYQNFERCLELVPRNIAFVALCDQDDYWHHNKVETLLSHFDDRTTLVYGDMNIIDESGDRIAESYWTNRPNNYSNLASLLLANTITGAACIFKGELLAFILPFPQKIGELYHDHWIGSIALTMGDIKYVDRPLYDYVQHSTNVIGHYVPSSPREQLWRLIKDIANVALRTKKRDRIIAAWNAIYHGDILRLKSMAYILELRCGNHVAHQKRRTLRRFVKLDESRLGPVWLLARGITRNTMRYSETMGAEYYLAKGVLWKEYTSLKGWLKKWYRVHDQHRTMHDDYYEPTHSHPTKSPASSEQIDIIQQKIAPLILHVSETAPRRVNIVVPTVDLSHFFGGYITKFNLARRLAEEGLKVRIVTVDPNPELPLSWRQQLQAYQGLEKLFDHVELVHAYDRTVPLEVNHDDVFIATTWWTAHIAHRAVRDIDKERFIYLIQEYEPFTFPMGTFAALATQTYSFPHFAIFSSELLRDYFRKNALGVFSGRAEIGERHSLSFQNAITAVGDVTVEQIANRSPKKLLFYARPELHAARNMFELAILALAQAIDAGCFTGEWEFFGIGTIDTSGTINLAKGFDLQLLPRQSQSVYRDLLLAHDVGLSLMYTPHPSLVPIEMASAGMLVVTNTYANKTQASLSAISSNFIAVEPTIEDVRRGLEEAVAKIDDYAQRVQGSHVNWSTCWEQTFDTDVITQIRAFIEGL